MGDWNNRKVLVTGGGGFIGSHLAERLAEKGANVRAMVQYNAMGSRGWFDHSPLANDMEIITGDITDRDSISKAIGDADVIFHLAALIAIPYSYDAPASYLRTNVEGTINVLQAARTKGVERVLHTSTSEVYGTAQYTPIDESHPLQGQSPYSASKIAADKMVEAFWCSFDLPVVTVRPFNTYGPRQSARAVIPTIIAQALSRNVIKLGNTAPTRDFTFVRDTVDGFIAIAEAPAEKVTGKTINLGVGAEISIDELARKIAKLVGHDVELVTDETRLRPKKSEVDRLLSDNSLIRNLTDWQPACSLNDGLGATIDFIRDHLDLYRPDEYTI